MLNAIGDSGQAVDWWFAFKLPRNARSPSGSSATPPSTGFEYVYFDDRSTTLTRSGSPISAPGGALYDTLHQIYPLTGAADGAPGFVVYNDERSDGKSDNGELGHTKGVLAFDPATDSGFWLLHSTPRFPTPSGCDFPQNEKDYAQTYLCITLKDFATVQQIAAQMIDQQEPQVFASRLSAGVPADSPLARLTQPLSPADPAPPATLEFTSRGGQAFRCIAKNRHWNSDYWNDLVGPALGVNLDVETWRRGKLAGTEDSDLAHSVLDTLYINLEPLGVDYEWHYTQDHAKWACSQTPNWVVVADINRDTSQEKRGGGGIAFQHPACGRASRRWTRSSHPRKPRRRRLRTRFEALDNCTRTPRCHSGTGAFRVACIWRRRSCWRPHHPFGSMRMVAPAVVPVLVFMGRRWSSGVPRRVARGWICRLRGGRAGPGRCLRRRAPSSGCPSSAVAVDARAGGCPRSRDRLHHALRGSGGAPRAMPRGACRRD